MTIRGIARKYDIPESTLRDKLSGRIPMKNLHGGKRLLTEPEEQCLYNWIVGEAKDVVYLLQILNLFPDIRK